MESASTRCPCEENARIDVDDDDNDEDEEAKMDDADADAKAEGEEEPKEGAVGALHGGGTSLRDSNLGALDDNMVCLRQ